MKYFMPSGDWPLKSQPYHDLMKKAGFTEGDHNSEILLLPGGADLGMRPGRDFEEFLWWAKWTLSGKPIIGICRGMQVMLHLTGNKIIENIPDVLIEIQHTTREGDWLGESSFHTTKLGLNTNSRHHQGFTEVNKFWEILDSTQDGMIESVISKGINNKQFGVQWHPEHEEMNGTAEQEWWIETIKQVL